MAQERSFDFVVQGQYYGVHDTTGTPAIKHYTAKFKLPTIEAALSKICKYLLDPYLRKHFPDYAKFRSHRITEVKVNGKDPDRRVLQMGFDDMTTAELADFCILKQIFIDPFEHKDLEKVRNEIRSIYEARIAQAKADQKSGAALEQSLVDRLLAMNELPKITTEININEQRLMTAVKTGDPVKMTEVPKDVPEDDPLGGLPPADDGDLLT